MRSLLILALPAALASELEVCANDGTCAQDEATLLQLQGLRAKLEIKHKQAPANQIQGCPTSSNFDDDFVTGNVRCCSMDGADGNSGNFPRTVTFSDGSSTTGRDCNAGECNNDADATCHDDVTFAQAAELCRANGERLCTQEEIGVTCGTGCMHNHHYVWFSDDPPNMAQGCPGSSQAYDETSGAVRCCSMDGTVGNSGNFPRTFTFADGSSTTGRDCNAGECNGVADTTCHDDVTFAQAEEMCRANGERLCTRDEVSVTCGTGCRHNHHLVWVSDLTPITGASEYVGCFVDDGARDFGAMVGSATNEDTDSFLECARVCDKTFIALQWGGECFCSDSYGNGDQYVQVDDSECDHAREPCASTSHNCGGTWRQAVYQIRPITGTNSDGCQTSNSYGEDEFPTTAQTDPAAEGGVRCCSWDGSSCQTQNLPGSVVAQVPDPGPAGTEQACYTHVTYAKALDVCNEAGMRLCSVEELDSGVCCGTGCWNDHRAIWVQPSCAGLYEAEDANMNGGQVDANHDGFTGSGFYNPVDSADDSVEWTLPGCAPGATTLSFRYALSSGSRPTRVFVNDVEVETAFEMPFTGAWDSYGDVTLSVTLRPGQNTVKMQVGASSAPNIDSLTVQ